MSHSVPSALGPPLLASEAVCISCCSSLGTVRLRFRTLLLRCPFGIDLWLVCALYMSESSENAASQCAHREHAPNDVEGNIPVQRGRECHRKTAAHQCVDRQ